jgi:hypothetical protein
MACQVNTLKPIMTAVKNQAPGIDGKGVFV